MEFHARYSSFQGFCRGYPTTELHLHSQRWSLWQLLSEASFRRKEFILSAYAAASTTSFAENCMVPRFRFDLEARQAIFVWRFNQIYPVVFPLTCCYVTDLYVPQQKTKHPWMNVFYGHRFWSLFFSHSEARMDPLAQVFNTNLWALKISLKGGGWLSPLKEISDVFFIWQQLLQHILNEGQNARFVPWSKLLPCATGIDVTSANTASCCDFEKFQHPNSL
jgi:hypothetical protein